MAPRTKTLQDRFYASLGRFTVMWACMEMGPDVLALLTSEVDSPLRQKTPHQLAAKVEFVRKHLLSQLAQTDRAKLEAMLSKIDRISGHRHDLIHGASLAERRDGEDWLVTFGALLQPRNRARRPTVKFTVGEIDKMTKEVSDLWGDLLDFAEGLARGQGYPETRTQLNPQGGSGEISKRRAPTIYNSPINRGASRLRSDPSAISFNPTKPYRI